MKKIVLAVAFCAVAFGFGPLDLVFGASEKKSAPDYEGMIKGGVAIADIMIKAKGSYLTSNKQAYATVVLLAKNKMSRKELLGGSLQGLGNLNNKQALQMLNDGCYNYDKYMSKAAAQQYYTAERMIARNNAEDLLNLTMLANPKTKKDVKMDEIKDEQIISDKIDVIVASCSGLAMYYKKNGNKKKANELVNIGAKNACSFAISKESKTECEAKTKEGLTELLNEMP